MYIKYYNILIAIIFGVIIGYLLGQVSKTGPIHYFVIYHDGDAMTSYTPELSNDKCVQDVFDFHQKQIEYLKQHPDDTDQIHIHAWCI